jgi:hypothetical protein
MDATVSAIRNLLAAAERGEVAGVAYTAALKAGGVLTGFAGDFGPRIVQLVDVKTGDRVDLTESPE